MNSTDIRAAFKPDENNSTRMDTEDRSFFHKEENVSDHQSFSYARNDTSADGYRKHITLIGAYDTLLVENGAHGFERLVQDNPFIGAATPLLAMMCDLELIVGAMSESEFTDSSTVYETVHAEALRLSDYAVKQLLGNQRIPRRLAEIAHYALCCYADERILTSDWGMNSPWAEQTHLSIYHDDSYGGTRFFEMLNTLSVKDPLEKALTELMLLLISLGYLGKYGANGGNNLELTALAMQLKRTASQESAGVELKEIVLRPKVLRDNVVHVRKPTPLLLHALVLFSIAIFGIGMVWNNFDSEIDYEKRQAQISFDSFKSKLQRAVPVLYKKEQIDL